MEVKLRLPDIKGSEVEQLKQIRSYLYQLIPQLQFALDNVSANSEGLTATPKSLLPARTNSYAVSTLSDEDDTAQSTFNSIKSLIIKSADIVEAYYQEINRRLESVYVAQSDFGDFAERTSQEIEETSASTTQRFENIQVIITNHDSELSSVKGDLQTIGEDISYQQKDFITIRENVDDIASEVVNLEINIGELDTTLQETSQTLSKTINDTESKLTATITETKTVIEGSIGNAVTEAKGYTDSAKTQLEGNINSTKEELVGSIDIAKEELTGSIDNVKTNLEGSIGNAVANANALADAAEAAAKGYTDDKASTLAGQIGETASDLKGQIVDTNSRIDDTNGALEDIGSGLEDTNKRLVSAEGALEAAKSALSNSIQKVADSISATDKLLESAKAQLKGSIDDLTIIVTGLKDIIIGVEAYLKSGLLYYTDGGIPVYGLEIGQTVEVDGTTVFNKYARFTSEKLSFYDQNGIEVAYISDKKLYIKMAHITVSLQLGGIVQLVMANGDIVKKWVGTGG